MDAVFNILTLLGSLGLFLYGMTLMSEALQKVAGDKLRNILAAMTSNSVSRILTGLFITAVIQSSSATTVMVVSFVNAGVYWCNYGRQHWYNIYSMADFATWF